jgi:hypothetical protein
MGKHSWFSSDIDDKSNKQLLEERKLVMDQIANGSTDHVRDTQLLDKLDAIEEKLGN